LADVYVKALRWAFDRIGSEGIIAYITNNSFANDRSFDGMRKSLIQDCEAIYILNLGGNVRKNPKLSGTTHNVFGIQIGVSINFFIRKRIEGQQNNASIFYYETDEFWKKFQKYEFLDKMNHIRNIEWKQLNVDKRFNWLTENESKDFEAFIPIGSKETRASDNDSVIFKNYGRGVATCRDSWVYNFHRDSLTKNIRAMIDSYNHHVLEWNNAKIQKIDDFVTYDDTKISWSEGLKNYLSRRISIGYDEKNIRNSIYRPFTKNYLYFDRYIVERLYRMPFIFPKTESENQVIWLKVGSEVPMFALVVNVIPDLLPQGGSQCFPFYIYDEYGTNRQENITDWALEQFRAHYSDTNISKWDIFHYVYAVLQHLQYRETYAANLKRELPRIPFTPDFWGFVQAGKQLAQIHEHYEDQEEYPLETIETPGLPLNWRVEKMRLSKDKTQIVYNDFLTLAGIPPEAFEYRLGNRSALDWIIDQYQVKTDKRSGIVNDPNRSDETQYIVRLIGKVITVSLETMKIVKNLPGLE
jgi:predicted helicase